MKFTVEVSTPAPSTVAPPEDYFLFLFRESAVPSKGKKVPNLSEIFQYFNADEFLGGTAPRKRYCFFDNTTSTI